MQNPRLCSERNHWTNRKMKYARTRTGEETEKEKVHFHIYYERYSVFIVCILPAWHLLHVSQCSYIDAQTSIRMPKNKNSSTWELERIDNDGDEEIACQPMFLRPQIS